MTSSMPKYQQPPALSANAPSSAGINLNVNNLITNNTCIHTQNQALNHMAASEISHLIEDGNSTSYFMNKDSCLETTNDPMGNPSSMLLGAGLPAAPPPPPLGVAPGAPNVIHPPSIKSLVQDVQLKQQKEIREVMKKKREKAMLVDRISRWLFPTSFILLNLVYWALFGDHELWQ